MMRKQLAVVALATIAAFGLALSSRAQVLFSDAFNYSPGALNSANTGGAWGIGTGNSGLTVVSGNLTYPGLYDTGGNEAQIANGSAGTIGAAFANQTSGQVWISLLFDPTAADSANNYFMAMNPGTSTPNGGSDAIDAYYYASGKIEVRANAAAATAGTGTALTLNTVNLIVEEIDLTAKTASLWVNPSSLTFANNGLTPTATASISGITATAVDDVGLKAQSSAGGPYLIDNVIVGQTWADVTPVVPEPSTYLLVGTGLAMMLGFIRRRRS
ncbi:MAG TPA: PEP-CTERM sorting domain-containing protein [Verrucomicrobiae bacterium]|nr:PEP-CTERM sorting domain-containing protein [Verrucomicrobiae bacterium]